MYCIANKSEQCIDCSQTNDNSENNNGWFICQDCYQIFCSRHCIVHRHDSSREEEPLPVERYNRYDHLDHIAEWERKAIEKIRKQADEARRPLIAPPTPTTPSSPLTTFTSESNLGPFTRLLSSLALSKTGEQVSTTTPSTSLALNKFELLSDETLDELIGDGSLTSPPNERKSLGRISFASQIPYINGTHHLRLIIDKFQTPSSWAFVGIISEGLRQENSSNQTYFNRSSFGWHLGRQSTIHDRHTSVSSKYDGRDIRQGDILTIRIDCDGKTIKIKNERTLHTHIIGIDSHCCPLPWLFVVNFNYKQNDSMYLLH